jgi:hypothetical protein
MGGGDNPIRSFRRAADGRCARVDRALPGDATQILRRGVLFRIGLQIRIIGRIFLDHLPNVLRPSRTIWRGNQAFDVEPVGVQKEVHHRLEIVGIGSSDVGGDDYWRALIVGVTAALCVRGRERQYQAACDQTAEGHRLAILMKLRQIHIAPFLHFSCCFLDLIAA